jgi:hypothetical protein
MTLARAVPEVGGRWAAISNLHSSFFNLQWTDDWRMLIEDWRLEIGVAQCSMIEDEDENETDKFNLGRWTTFDISDGGTLCRTILVVVFLPDQRPTMKRSAKG